MSNGSGLFTNKGPVQSRFMRPGGVRGEVSDLRTDVATALAALIALTVDEFTNPPAADADGLKAGITSATTATAYVAADLDGAIGPSFTEPRNVTVTCDDSASTWAGPVLFVGKDVEGRDIQESVVLTNNTTTAGTKLFAEITNVSWGAQVDANGTITLGIGTLLGLSQPIKSRAGVLNVVREIAAGAAVTNGTFSSAATNAPYGAYVPNTAPNGTNDYAVVYEFDPII